MSSKTSHLLLIVQEVGQLFSRQVILPVTVGHHQQEQIASQRHHLVEDGELLIRQRALLVVSVRLLQGLGSALSLSQATGSVKLMHFSKTHCTYNQKIQYISPKYESKDEFSVAFAFTNNNAANTSLYVAQHHGTQRTL